MLTPSWLWCANSVLIKYVFVPTRTMQATADEDAILLSLKVDELVHVASFYLVMVAVFKLF